MAWPGKHRFVLFRPVALAVLLLWLALSTSAATVSRVDSVGVTVSNLDRAIEFYTKVLSFEKVSEVEVTGEA